MAANRIVPPRPDPPEEVAVTELQHRQEEERKLGEALHAGSVAQIIVGLAVVLAICYFAKLVLVTLMVSVLLAFMLEPLVSIFERVRLPRSAASLIAVLVLLGACWGASYFFYSRAVSFSHELPKYSEKIRGIFSHIVQQTNKLEQTTEKILPKQQQQSKNAVPVRVENSGGSGFISKNIGTVTELVLTVSFIPFLVYFMLSWQEHARTKTVQLFPQELRSTAYVTVGQIGLMMRSFIAGNFIIGIFMGIISLVVFGALGLPYFYFLGFISGFLSLVPYLGVILAAIPPLAAGLGTLKDSGLIIVIATVLALHVFSMNVLYPKVLGKRLQLNPLVVVISLLVWGWIWGALGLILAVPIMGAIKIVCDNITSLRPVGEWMGE
jgi:predicted PurR-regulated permease PerM